MSAKEPSKEESNKFIDFYFYLEKTNVIGLGEMRKALKHNLF
jgi:hypothetical protein